MSGSSVVPGESLELGKFPGIGNVRESYLETT